MNTDWNAVTRVKNQDSVAVHYVKVIERNDVVDVYREHSIAVIGSDVNRK